MASEPIRPISPKFTLGGDGADIFTESKYWEGVLGKRFVAYLVDVVVLGLIWMALGLLMVFSFGLLAPLTALLWAVTPIAYHTFMVSSRGATVGHQFAGLRIVDASTGQRPNLVQAFILTCLFYISISFAFLPLLYVLFDPQDRFLHDLLSNTRSLKAQSFGDAD